MVAIIFPVIYLLIYRNLLAYIKEREQAVAELRQLQSELGLRVDRRTAELSFSIT